MLSQCYSYIKISVCYLLQGMLLRVEKCKRYSSRQEGLQAATCLFRITATQSCAVPSRYEVQTTEFSMSITENLYICFATCFLSKRWWWRDKNYILMTIWQCTMQNASNILVIDRISPAWRGLVFTVYVLTVCQTYTVVFICDTSIFCASSLICQWIIIFWPRKIITISIGVRIAARDYPLSMIAVMLEQMLI